MSTERLWLALTPVSTPALLGLRGEVTKLSLPQKKKKGGGKKKITDLLQNWPYSVEREYQVIELIHAVFSCLGKMICFIVCLLQLIKGKRVPRMQRG